MNLELFNKTLENARENKEVVVFVKELSNYLEKEEHKIMDMTEIEEKYNLNYDSAFELKRRRNEILKEYICEQKIEKLYYVSYKNPDKDIYKIIECNQKGDNASFYLSKEALPDGIAVDKVISKKGNQFEIDEGTTKTIIDRIEEGAKQIANEQNAKLLGFREEDGLYRVVDFSNKGVFLKKINNTKIFEETNISKEVKDKIGNDAILRYKNGKYIYEEDLTDRYLI